MPLLPTMSSLKQSSTHIDQKYAAMEQAAMQHMQNTISTNDVKKSLVSYRTVSPAFDDFDLFSDTEKTKKHASSESPRCHKSTQKTMRNQFSPNPPVADTRKNYQGLPRRKRTPRHGGFKLVPMIDDDEKRDAKPRRWPMNKPPPAPLPPRLDSPDLSEIEENTLWPSSRRNSTSSRRSKAST